MRLGHFLGWLKPVAPPERESRPTGLPPARPLPDQEATRQREASMVGYSYNVEVRVWRDGAQVVATRIEGKLGPLDVIFMDQSDSVDDVVHRALMRAVRDHEEMA